jgi:hypothetical protein
MTDDALFWHRLNLELGQLRENEEFRQLVSLLIVTKGISQP